MVNVAPEASACVCECAFRLKDTSSKSRLWKLEDEKVLKGKRRFNQARTLHGGKKRKKWNTNEIHLWTLN